MKKFRTSEGIEFEAENIIKAKTIARKNRWFGIEEVKEKTVLDDMMAAWQTVDNYIRNTFESFEDYGRDAEEFWIEKEMVSVHHERPSDETWNLAMKWSEFTNSGKDRILRFINR